MVRRMFAALLCIGLATGSSGCAYAYLCKARSPEITAVSLNPADGMCGMETGIPFYLPKPLLIVSKNFRNIETQTVGITDPAPIPNSFDDQAKYADLNARTNFAGLNGAAPAADGGKQAGALPPAHSASGAPLSPNKLPGDGLAPETFYTYQIVYVPDMSKRYGLKLRGGPGEMRAAMNLVNGWQFTGTGPFYLKDSSTAQNVLAAGISTRLGGAATADVINAGANLAKAFPGSKQSGDISADDARVQKLSEAIAQLPKDMIPMTLVNFAEIHVYEPNLTPDGEMCWKEIVGLNFNRDYLGAKSVIKEFKADEPKKPNPANPPAGQQQSGIFESSSDEALARAAVASVFGLPVPAVSGAGGLQSGQVGVPAGGMNQIQVDCGSDKCGPSKEINFIKFGGWHKADAPRPKIQNRTLTVSPVAVPDGVFGPPAAPNVDPNRRPTAGGGAQAGAIDAAPCKTPTIVNQPIFNNAGASNLPAPHPVPPKEKKD